MSFFTHIESFFKKFVTNTTWEQKAAAGIAMTAPSLQTIVALTAGEQSAVQVALVVGEVQTDLATLSGLLAQSKSGVDTSATITNVLEAIKTNLSALLSAGHIKDEATLQKVTAITSGVIEEVEAILPLIPKQ